MDGRRWTTSKTRLEGFEISEASRSPCNLGYLSPGLPSLPVHISPHLHIWSLRGKITWGTTVLRIVRGNARRDRWRCRVQITWLTSELCNCALVYLDVKGGGDIAGRPQGKIRLHDDGRASRDNDYSKNDDNHNSRICPKHSGWLFSKVMVQTGRKMNREAHSARSPVYIATVTWLDWTTFPLEHLFSYTPWNWHLSMRS